MQKNALQETTGFLVRNHRRRTWRKIVSALACVVVFYTTYALILPAITMENTIYCGLEEHQHSSECYQKVLICGKDEPETHIHSAECYTQKRELVCGMEESSAVHTHTEDCISSEQRLICENEDPEHQHTEECYETDTTYICGLEEGAATGHVHTDACYAVSEVLQCGLADSEEASEHTHTDECYELVLKCEKEEHTHDLGCYSDPEADVESPEVWERSVSQVELTGNWQTDVLAIAESQLGYTESSRNYIVDENGTKKGYTRYGDWYGDAYGDWCAMFVSFCLHYAEVDGFPLEASCPRWIEALQQEENDFYRAAGDYTPKAGDLIFFDTDGNQLANHIGLVAEIIEATGTEPARIRTIEGNSNNCVQHVTYYQDDARIMGYGELPEHIQAEETETVLQMNTLDFYDDNAGMSGARNGTVQSLNVTSASGSGTTYNPETKQFKTELKINFSITKEQLEKGLTYKYTYSDNVIVPDTLLGVYENLYNDAGDKVGTYTYIENGDGTCSAVATIDEEYADEAGEKITGHIQFGGTLNATSDESGDIQVNIGGNVNLTVESKDISYPSDETDKADIAVSKSGSYISADNQLVYTVFVRSYKGTPDAIDFNDVLTPNGLILGTPTVKVERGTFLSDNKNDVRYNENSWSASDDITPEINGNNIYMDLPKIEPGDSTAKKYNCYKITYTYDLGDQEIETANPNNKVTVKSKDEKTGKTVEQSANATIPIDRRYSIGKTGAYNTVTGKIDWKITINNNYVNIAGATVTDEMFAQLTDTDFKVNQRSGYEFIRDADGNITGIKFTEVSDGANNQYYEITYSTDADQQWGSQTVSNTAYFDPTPDSDPDDVLPGEAEVTVPATGVTKQYKGDMAISEDGSTGTISWTVTIDVPAAGIPAGTVIDDQVATGWNGTSQDQWMTAAQITVWAKSFSWDVGGTRTLEGTDVTFTASDGTDYTYQQIKNGNIQEGLKFNRFNIKFTNALVPPNNNANKLSFTYETTVDLTKAQPGETRYYNYVKVGEKTADATYPYHKGGVIKTDGNGNTGKSNVQSEGSLTWRIQVWTDSSDISKLTISDILPKNVILDSISLSEGTTMDLKYHPNDTNISGSNDNYIVSGTLIGQEINLTMTGKNNSKIAKNTKFVFTVTCHVDEEVLGTFENGQPSIEFKNSVTVNKDGELLGTSQQTQTWTYYKEEKNPLEKLGTWDNSNRRLNYTVEINPEGKTLLDSGGTLTLIDDLTYSKDITVYPAWPRVQYSATIGARLIPNSIKLYYAAVDKNGEFQKDEKNDYIKGEEITNVSWTIDTDTKGNQVTKKLTVSGIPDGTPLVFEYAYSVDSTIQKGDTVYSLPFSNTARLEGTTYQDAFTPSSAKWEDVGTSGGVDTEKKYIFYKTHEGDYSKRLPNAEFTVYSYKADGVYTDADKVKTYTTDSDGKFEIKWNEMKDDGTNLYQYNTLYAVRETKAPDGYKMQEPVKDYYFYFSSDTDAGHTLPSPLPDDAVNLTERTGQAFVPNACLTTEITVKKVWQDNNGNVTTMHGDSSVTVNLYRKVSESEEGPFVAEGVSTLNAEIKLGDKTNGHQWIGPSTLTYASGTTVTFSLTDYYGDKNPPELAFNGNELNGSKDIQYDVPDKTNPNWTHKVITYTYTIPLQSGNNVLSGCTPGSWNATDWIFSGFPESSTLTLPTVSDPATLNDANNWTYTFTDLELEGKDGDGNPVYYTYYVVENSVANYETTYDNNDGIKTGTITVYNKAQFAPSHELPATGGSGTTPYTMGGLLMISAGGLLLYNKKKRRKEDCASS